MNLIEISNPEPWTGARYAVTGLAGRKVMILGESAYNRNGYPDDYDPSRHSIELIRDAVGHGQGRGYCNKGPVYMAAARIFGYNPQNHEERGRFWNAVAFHNFIPVIFTGPKVPPHERHWTLGASQFPAIVEAVEPDYIVCLSKRMWSYLPKRDDGAIDAIDKSYARRGAYTMANGKRVSMLGFAHPSHRGSFKRAAATMIVEDHVMGENW